MKKKEFITGAAGTLALTVRRATTLTATLAAMMLLVMMLTTATATAAVINVASTADLGTKTAGSDETYSDYYLLADGNTYRLTADVNLDGYLRMENATVTIDLNGHKLNRGLTESTKLYNGGVINVKGGTLAICDSGSGGTITGGYSRDGAGGVYIWNSGAVIMTGGTISGNYADKYVGGVGIHYSSSFTMTGGTITNNTCSSNGKCGGVNIGNNSKQKKYGTFNVSGSASVTANKLGSTTSNVYLPSGGTINVTGALTDNASVGVTMENQSDFIAQGSGYTLTTDDATHFKSDVSGMYVALNANEGKLYLTDMDPALLSVLTWNADGHYFAIADEQDLIDLAEYIRGGRDRYCEGATFKMTADLDFTDMPLNCHDKYGRGTGNFLPIGIDNERGGSVFKGHFDGQGHTVTGLQFSYPHNIIGLFRTISTTSATVENLTLVNPAFSASNEVGGIVAFLGAGTISNCHVVGGSVTASDENVGGIVALSYYDTSADVKTITGCSVVGTTVSGSNCVGAIVGNNTNSNAATAALTISNCTYDAATNENICGYGYGTMFTDGGGNVMVDVLYDRGDEADGNAAVISSHDTETRNVMLYGRTLYRDSKWNTICLPFDVTISGSALDGADARPLTAASIEGTTLNLTFGNAVTTLVAGTPYIIKWDAEATDIESPVFSGVTIDKTPRGYDTDDVNSDADPDNNVVTEERVRFLGTYRKTAFDEEDKSILLMGGGNTLYYPQHGAAIGACRAYFKIGADGEANARRMTAFNIGFGDEQTAITTLAADVKDSAAWYTLDGRRLSGKPAKAGIYVSGGRKVMIK